MKAKGPTQVLFVRNTAHLLWGWAFHWLAWHATMRFSCFCLPSAEITNELPPDIGPPETCDDISPVFTTGIIYHECLLPREYNISREETQHQDSFINSPWDSNIPLRWAHGPRVLPLKVGVAVERKCLPKGVAQWRGLVLLKQMWACWRKSVTVGRALQSPVLNIRRVQLISCCVRIKMY